MLSASAANVLNEAEMWREIATDRPTVSTNNSSEISKLWFRVRMASTRSSSRGRIITKEIDPPARTGKDDTHASQVRPAMDELGFSGGNVSPKAV